MYPELFDFLLPDFLTNLFGVKKVTVYPTLIALGTLIAVLYTKWRVKRELGVANLPNTFFYLIFITGFVGGKLFYGSFVVIIPLVIWYLKKTKVPVLPMLDVFAITTAIIHGIGHLGCFSAGCCYGSPAYGNLGMVFPTTHSTSVHPTQLYESLMLVLIMGLLLFIKRKKQFNGQIFFIYLMLYAFGRSSLELYRGDDRGFIIDDVLSHPQFIALGLISISAYFYYKFYKQLNLISINT